MRVKPGGIELQIYKDINPNVLSSVYIAASHKIKQHVFFIHGPREILRARIVESAENISAVPPFAIRSQ